MRGVPGCAETYKDEAGRLRMVKGASLVEIERIFLQGFASRDKFSQTDEEMLK